MIRTVLALGMWTILIWGFRALNIGVEEAARDPQIMAWCFVGLGLICIIGLYLWAEDRLNTLGFAIFIWGFAALSITRWAISTTRIFTQTNTNSFRAVHVTMAIVTAALGLRASYVMWRLTKSERSLPAQQT